MKPKLPPKLSKDAVLKLWTQKVKDRDRWTCQLCGKSAPEVQIHAHHIRGRASNALKFDLQNGIALCADHHKWHGVHSPDGGIAKDAIAQVIEKIGAKRWNYLSELKACTKKLSLSEAWERLNV